MPKDHLRNSENFTVYKSMNQFFAIGIIFKTQNHIDLINSTLRLGYKKIETYFLLFNLKTLIVKIANYSVL